MTLFDDSGLRVDPPPEEEVSRGEQLRRRQRARIAAGLHPLSINGMRIPLHPDAPRDSGEQHDPRTYPRCGTCVHRKQTGGHARDFPKCLIGYVRRELTPAEREANRGTWRENHTHYVDMGPRFSRSEASDVRAYWPACVDYEQVPPQASQ